MRLGPPPLTPLGRRTLAALCRRRSQTPLMKARRLSGCCAWAELALLYQCSHKQCNTLDASEEQPTFCLRGYRQLYGGCSSKSHPMRFKHSLL